MDKKFFQEAPFIGIEFIKQLKEKDSLLEAKLHFDEMKKNEVIKIMRSSLKPSSFKLWRKRAKNQSIKHRKKFELSRKEIRRKIRKNDYI